MRPVAISTQAKAARPWASTIVVGPPINDDLGCEPVEALVATTEDEGTTFRIPWRPDDIELAAINDGQPVWLVLYCPQMPPVSLNAGPV